MASNRPVTRSSFEESSNLDYDGVHSAMSGADIHQPILAPIKKLSDAFETCYAESIDSNNNQGMKVFLRVRPCPNNAESTITLVSDTSIVTNAPESSKRAQYTKKEERQYTFNRIFGPDSIQPDIYDTIASPLHTRFIQGENVLLFAYGMTNAGKTWTIQGTENNEGILPRLIKSSLSQISSLKQGTITVSMLEVYQEKIYDLLCTSDKREKLNIRDANGRVEVVKLSSHKIESVYDSSTCMNLASTRR